MLHKIKRLYNKYKSNPKKVRVVGDFFVVEPSVWPFLTAMGIFLLVLSTVAFFHYVTFGLFFLLSSFVILIGIASLWWKDLIAETSNPRIYTGLIQSNLKLGMILFIFSEVMFFSSFFWAFFHSSLSPSIFIGGVWPPDLFFEFGKVIDPWELPFLNTLYLLLSGVFVTWAHHSLPQDEEDAFFGLFFCLFCAVFFTGWQVYEYHFENLLLSDGIYGSCFFLLTGFHGIHVIGGTIFLTVCTIRLRYNGFSDGKFVGLDCAVWYWHFVDVVWIFLFIFVYVWGNYATPVYVLSNY